MGKRIYLLLVTMLLVGFLAACGSEAENDNNASNGEDASGSDNVDISIFMTKPEIVQEFNEVVDVFSEETGIGVTVIPLGDQVVLERMTTLYSSGNAPTITLANMEIAVFKDNLLDLSGEPWVETIPEDYFNLVNYDGAILGQPLGVEGFGFIYNKAVLDEATGGFDPSTIKSHDDLRNLFEEVEALDGVNALTISPVDWSLGAHLTNPMFASQSSESAERHEFMDAAIDGEASFADNEVFQGWVDTLDLMKEFNKHKDSALAPAYEDAPLELASGEVGLWFMGNWAYPQIAEVDPDGEYGFLPVPISNDPTSYGNSQMSVGAPSFWVVDAEQSTEEEQEAAKQFLNWLMSSETGKDLYVNKLNLIPVSENFDIAPEDPLSQSIVSYMDSDNTLEFMVSHYPADAMNVMGASLQKYLVDELDRDGLAQEFDNYWHAVERE